MRKIWDIHGGIHPPENKDQSLTRHISHAGVPPTLVVPLSQHIGAPATPCVAVGDHVLKGQTIADAEGFISVPVHAPSSGEVIAIENRDIPHASGMQDTCIVIATDGREEWIEREAHGNWVELEESKLLQLIRAAGISGMGGAGFPSAVKLNPPPTKVIDTLIINGTECEPYITADHALLRERPSQLAEGIAILCKLINPLHIIIGIEDNKLDVVAGVKQAIEEIDYSQLGRLANDSKEVRRASIEIVTFPTKYPSGGEKQLIEILTGKQVPKGGLPADLGIVCHNPGTAIAIRNAVIDGTPLIERITTLTGDAIKDKGNVDVLLGTPIQYLLEQFGFDHSINNRLIMGGPMMGFALKTSKAPIIKITNCILAPSENELPTPPPAQACIRCGMCAEACPASLLPQQLFWFAQGKELDKLTQHNLADCIECGACSYVCPSHIPLVQYYRASKAEIRQRDQDLIKAEASKVRFDARQERLDRLEAEKLAARKARQEKAKARSAAAKQAGDTNLKDSQDAKAAAIAAAVARANNKKASKPTDSKQPESANPDDPVAKALAARAQSATMSDADKAAQALEKAEQRLEKTQQRLIKAEQENDDNLEAFKAAAEKARSKLDALKDTVPPKPEQTKDPHAEQEENSAIVKKRATEQDDPVARALAKRAATASTPALSSAEKAQQAMEKAEQRLEKAKLRLKKAEADQDPNIAAFSKALEKAETKAAQAKQAFEATTE